MVVDLPELLRIHPELPRHLHVRVGEPVTFAGFDPGLQVLRNAGGGHRRLLSSRALRWRRAAALYRDLHALEAAGFPVTRVRIPGERDVAIHALASQSEGPLAERTAPRRTDFAMSSRVCAMVREVAARAKNLIEKLVKGRPGS
jgi:hypothetical protein